MKSEQLAQVLAELSLEDLLRFARGVLVATRAAVVSRRGAGDVTGSAVAGTYHVALDMVDALVVELADRAKELEHPIFRRGVGQA